MAEGKLENLGESTVKRALIRHYSEKFKNDSNKDSKIASALKATIPRGGGKTGGSLSVPSFGYVHGTNIPSDRKGVEDIIDSRSGYLIIYDSFAEGLEPIYFWVLDYMRDSYWGAGLDVQKTMDDFQASVGSGFFGDLGTKASVMQDRAMKMMTTVNQVVRSVINILYDLKEFDQRLFTYKSLDSKDAIEKNTARLALKQIWMDKVDVQRGRGSINMLAQQLQFVTLRDAFMAANSADDVYKGGADGKGMDLNERVKRILAPRLQEYETWETLSRAELQRRFEIEKSYLRSQVESLKLYSQWARPYLKAAQRLKQSDYRTPDLVSIFNNMQLQVSLFGKKEIKPVELHKPAEPLGRNKYENIKLPKKIYACVEVSMLYRTIPHTVSRGESGMHYAQGGKVVMNFRGFALDEDEVNAVEKEETYEGLELIEGMTTESIKVMQEEIDKYLKTDEKIKDLPPKEKEKALNNAKSLKEAKVIEKDLRELEKMQAKNKDDMNPFSPLKGSMDELKKMFSSLKPKPSNDRILSALREEAKKTAAARTYQVYLVYKKVHGMATE